MSNPIPAVRRRTPRSEGAALLVLALVVSSGLPRPGHADEATNAAAFNERNRAGTEAYGRQDFAEAIKNFQLAYALKSEALLLYNIAQCHRKLNHDGEAITFYQSFLDSPESTDRPLRAKAGRYITELRNRHLAPAQQQVIYVESARARRPLWRIGLGAGLLAASAVLLGFGGRALNLDGACVDSVMGAQLKCTSVLDTGGLGIGLVVTGAVVAIGGAVTIALPGRRYQIERPATPREDQPGVVQPMAGLLPAVQLALDDAGRRGAVAF